MQEILIEINMFVSWVVINPLTQIQTQRRKHWGRNVSVNTAKSNLQRPKNRFLGATQKQAVGRIAILILDDQKHSILTYIKAKKTGKIFKEGENWFLVHDFKVAISESVDKLGTAVMNQRPCEAKDLQRRRQRNVAIKKAARLPCARHSSKCWIWKKTYSQVLKRPRGPFEGAGIIPVFWSLFVTIGPGGAASHFTEKQSKQIR